jgi:hypothetical protein
MKRLAVAGLLLLLCACASTPSQPVPPRVPLPPPPPPGEPPDLIGLSGTQLQAMFGTPAFWRKEYGSEMWRYDTQQCKVFFFLYPAGKGLSVRHVETLPRGKDTAADPACLTVLRGKPASPVS